VSSRRVRVAFLWHMHQPYYRDLLTGRASLPWVRLHAVKDYHAMPAILARYPEVRVTFNFVPSLVRQIGEYTEDGLRDDFWDRTVVPAADLTADDRTFLLRNFFMTNWDLVIRRNPRYGELLEKRGFNPDERALNRAVTLFTAQDMLDLQVWFNLAWIHPIYFEEDADLAALLNRGRFFSEDDKKRVLDKQLDIMGRVVPLCRKLAEEGQIELSTTPFFHPILPLVMNTGNARESLPGLELPSPPFSRPEDVSLQLDRAVAFHAETFGRPPEGLWPSEGSVSEDILDMVIEQGFRWMATDEDILFRSFSGGGDRHVTADERSRFLYRPFRAVRGGRSLAMVFRDHALSDAIGFTYGRWEAAQAAQDLIGRIGSVAGSGEGGGEPLVTIILDGENPWEYYPDQGYPFLRELYRGLSRSTSVRAVTVGEGVAGSPEGDNIPRLFAGSWINHNFQIWIGHPEDRKAWEHLNRARAVIDRMGADDADAVERRRKALEEILIAEGSDWCWWYGDENSSGNDEAFDELYRRHLMNVYTLAGLPVPDELKVTIFSGRRVIVPITRIYSFINPTIDGRVSSYFEWLAAGEYFIAERGATMHRADRALAAIYFGFNLGTLFVRADFAMKVLAADLPAYTFNIHFLRPRRLRLEIPAAPPGQAVSPRIIPMEGEASPPQDGIRAAVGDILEAALPFDALGAKTGDTVDFFVSLSRDGRELGHWPERGFLSVMVPAEDFEEKSWSI
jgi:alpha-amylase/alpha-mannosidase (GH57 family)